MDANQTGFRVLMFPWLAHGHVFPFLELAKRLSKRNFHVYFCSTSINLDYVRKDLKKNASSLCDDESIQLVELQLPNLPELPPQYHTTKNIPPHLRATLYLAFQKSGPSFSDIIANLNPDLLIYDASQTWCAKYASAQGIPSVTFATSSSTTFSFFHHRHAHGNYESFPSPAISLREYEKRDPIVQYMPMKVADDIHEGIAFGIFQQSSDIVLVKGCRGIEGKYMDHFSTLCDRKIVPLGPLITDSAKHNQETADSEILNWLNQKSPFSTLYISFGSENFLSKEQMQEMAKGLELSGVNFVWVARSPLGSDIVIEEALPEGFLERTKERGLVQQGWAPQAAILAHPSVGGFFSHCGWSSVTESMYFGVPVVGLPFQIDQPVNCRLVVEVGVGVEVIRDENGQFDGNAVAKAIREVVCGESGEKLRRNARDLSEKMKMEEKDAISEAAEELKRICAKKSAAVSAS